MNLFPSLVEKYTKETLSAREAQRLAEFIAWGPVVFQASRIMLKWGVFDLLRDSIVALPDRRYANEQAILTMLSNVFWKHLCVLGLSLWM